METGNGHILRDLLCLMERVSWTTKDEAMTVTQ